MVGVILLFKKKSFLHKNKSNNNWWILCGRPWLQTFDADPSNFDVPSVGLVCKSVFPNFCAASVCRLCSCISPSYRSLDPHHALHLLSFTSFLDAALGKMLEHDRAATDRGEWHLAAQLIGCTLTRAAPCHPQ